MTTLQELIKVIRKLKPIPAIVNQLVEVLDDPSSSARDIAGLIQYDPSLTANLLKVCNSAYFGLANPVESVKDAVALIGTDQIVELVLLQAGSGLFADNQKGYGLYNGAMWRYSVASALIAKDISARREIGNKNTIFTAALLKDIGKTVLDSYVAGSLDSINRFVKDEGFSFREAEKKVLGIDHAELGAMIAKLWKFSPVMVSIIRHHHLADESMRNNKPIQVVYLADCICLMMGIGGGNEGLAYRFHEDVMKELSITHKDVETIILDSSMNMQKIEALISTV